MDDMRTFHRYFSGKIGEVENVRSCLFRKILFMDIMDALSRAGFPDAKGHRERMTRFLEECSGWKDKDRVSAVQLILILRERGRTCGSLYELAKETMDSWEAGSIILPQSDLLFEAADAAAKNNEKNFVIQATYKELFYTYRNHLVHEFREPGYGMESNSDSPTPYYHSMIGDMWQLVFPTLFIKRICMDSLKGLVALLHSQQRNPYDSYQFGSLWRRR